MGTNITSFPPTSIIGATAAGISLLTAANAAAQRSALGLGALSVLGSVDLSGSQASGTLAAARFPALSGDVTNTAGSLTTAIASGAVSLAKMAALAATSLIGNSTGSVATPTALSASQAKTLLAYKYEDLTLNPGGGFAMPRFPRNGIFVQVGDSNTDGRPAWEVAVGYEWTTRGGIFEGWTNVNLGYNGSQLAGWVDSIGTGSSSTATNTRGSLWAAVNNNPDCVIISLCTNDGNSPSNRATLGTLATMRANMRTAIEFVLSHTKKSCVIWLRMPAPLGFETFNAPAHIPEFASQAECNAWNVDLRTVYTDWDGIHPRVFVFNSHATLFGNTLSAVATDCLDPITNAQLMSDALHPNDLGYRRITELMSKQADPSRLPLPRTSITTPKQVFRDAVWSQTAFVSGRSGNTFSLNLNPQFFACDTTIVDANSAIQAFSADENRRGPVSQNRMGEFLRRACSQAAARQIIAAGGGSGQPSFYSGSVWMYWHTTGNLYQIDYLTLSQIVTGTPDYFQCTAVNASPSFAAGDTQGFVTFYTTNPAFTPYQNWRASPDVICSVPGGQTQASAPLLGSYTTTPIGRVLAHRGMVDFGTNGGAATVELRECNQGDGRYVAEATYAAGKVIASVSFGAGIYVGTVTLDPSTHYGTTTNMLMNSSSSYLRAFVTAGASKGDVTFRVCWR